MGEALRLRERNRRLCRRYCRCSLQIRNESLFVYVLTISNLGWYVRTIQDENSKFEISDRQKDTLGEARGWRKSSMARAIAAVLFRFGMRVSVCV